MVQSHLWKPCARWLQTELKRARKKAKDFDWLSLAMQEKHNGKKFYKIIRFTF